MSDKFDPKASDLTNVARGLFAIASAVESLANSVKWLGAGDDIGDGRGAIEFLAIQVRQGLENMGHSIDQHAKAVDGVGLHIEGVAVHLESVASEISGLAPPAGNHAPR